MHRIAFLVPLSLGCSDYAFKADVDEPAIPEDTAAVRTDDPETPGTEPTEPDSSAPVAVCDVHPNPVQPPFEAATWDGSASYDPDGKAIVGYEWTLVEKPTGSSVEMGPSGEKVANFSPDLAGQYLGELVVVNGDGVPSAPCQVVLESTPAQDLWIELYWTKADDDMDLHLLKPGGNLETQGDCYYANCVGNGPDWGTGSADDDPHLDLDDIPGTGPENINVQSPSDGVYTVIVHDYPESVMTEANSVTVKIYIGGALEWSDTRPIAGENSYTEFATIDWTAGSVTAL
jgi:hypothetical protein